ARRKLLDVTGEVLLDLALGLEHEAEIAAIPGNTCREPDGERTAVPQRVEKRRPVGKLVQTLPGPREVLFLLERRARELVLDGRVARNESLGRVERLRADLAGVVDAHECRCMALLVDRELAIFELAAWHGPHGDGAPGEGAQRAIETQHEIVDHRGALK